MAGKSFYTRGRLIYILQQQWRYGRARNPMHSRAEVLVRRALAPAVRLGRCGKALENVSTEPESIRIQIKGSVAQARQRDRLA